MTLPNNTSPNDLVIRAMSADDADAVLAIYDEGIATGHATFATSAPSWEDFDKGHIETCRLVATLADKIVGWAALNPVSSRHVYRGVAEESIYIASSARGGGVGHKLLTALVCESERCGFWTLQTGIFPENEASLRLHQKAGFRILGIRKRVGLMAHGPMKGHWRDVAFMERRSGKVGV